MTPRAVATVDEGQARGEIATPEMTLKHGPVPRAARNGVPTFDELGLDYRRVEEARLVRDVLGEAGVRD